MTQPIDRTGRDRPMTVALQGLLGLAPLAIMLSHWSEEQYLDFVPQQQINVDLIFCIEGFLTAALLLQSGPASSFRTLMADRLLKIYPLYALSLLLSVVLFLQSALSATSGLGTSNLGLVGTANLSLPEIQSTFLRNIVLLPSFVRDGHVFPLNPPTWAIAAEIYAFMLICALRRWITVPRLIAVTAVIAIANIAAIHHYHDVNMGHRLLHYWGGFPRCFYGFGAGMLVYHIVRHSPFRISGVHPLLIWGGFIAMLFVHVGRFHEAHAGIPFAMIGIPALVWLGAVSSEPAWLQPVARQGERLCYAMYSFHCPLLMLCYIAVERLGMATPAWLGSPLYYLICLIVLLAVSHLVMIFVERVVRSATKGRSVHPA